MGVYRLVRAEPLVLCKRDFVLAARVQGYNLLGEGLRDALDPKLRG